MAAAPTNDIISQKKFYKDLKAIHFHLQCLEESRQGAYDEALEEYSNFGVLMSKIRAYRKMVSLDENMDKTELALEECVMLELASIFVTQLTVERVRIGLNANKILDENDWLGKQNKLLKSRIQQLREKIMLADAEMQQYLFLYQIRQDEFPKSDIKLIASSFAKELIIDKNIVGFVSPQLKAFYPLALQYINSGRTESASSLCAQSRKGSKLTHTDEALIAAVEGLIYLRLRNGDAAVKSYTDSCKLMTSGQSKDSVCLVPILVGLGRSLRLVGNYKEAEVQFQQALTIKTANLKKPDEELWSIQTDIASVLLKLKKYSDASKLLLTAFEAASSSLNVYDPLIIRIKNYVARSYVAMDQPDEAFKLIEATLAEVYEHDGCPAITEVLKDPGKYNVNEGTDLISTSQQTNNYLELFTYQTLIYIYKKMKNEKSAYILDGYVHAHSINYAIE